MKDWVRINWKTSLLRVAANVKFRYDHSHKMDDPYISFICDIYSIIIMFRVFIIGTTGVGKTKLSIELAKYLKGEVISSDSKQLYKYATIMTAKVTEEQAEGVPHHMIDVLQLHQNAYNRNRYFAEAYNALQSIEKQEKTPIIVGGTNYYTETLLYDLQALPVVNNSESDDEGEKSSKKLTEQQQTKLQELKLLTKEEKYELLKQYDSLIAEKVHKNNEQKINLFLERMILSKRKISDNYQKLTHELKSNNTIVFWLRNSNKEELLGMITKRIHKMVDKAGITEILSIYHYLHIHRAVNLKEENVSNYEEYSGAASSIGIKEFLPLYLEVRQQLLNLIPVQQAEVGYSQIHDIISKHFQELGYSKEILSKCTEQLILDTKHYCKRQVTWIRNRMFLTSEKARHHFFVLDLQQNGEEVLDIHQRFERQIRQKAIEIIQTIREHGFGHVLQEQLHFAENKAIALENWKNFYCEPCNLEVNGEFDWKMHLQSKRHIKQVKYQEKKDEREQHVALQKSLAEERRRKKEQEEEAHKLEKNEEKQEKIELVSSENK